MAVTCPICGDEFETDEMLAQHDHEMPVPWEKSGAGFECPECGAMFDAQEHLIEHQAAGHAGTTG
ncbi:MAG TPA: C2H2-type zinc finger protein [Actinomycetota bacterium]|nr:C2H2-type zinc finger protein [Actinomycetota bacterium]